MSIQEEMMKRTMMRRKKKKRIIPFHYHQNHNPRLMKRMIYFVWTLTNEMNDVWVGGRPKSMVIIHVIRPIRNIWIIYNNKKYVDGLIPMYEPNLCGIGMYIFPITIRIVVVVKLVKMVHHSNTKSTPNHHHHNHHMTHPKIRDSMF